MEKVKATDKARTAMAIDCEGTVGVYFQESSQGYPRTVTLVSVANTRKELLLALKKIWGFGSIELHQEHKHIEKWAASYRWVVRKRKEVEYLLKTVKPYLILKKPQADLILHMIRWRNRLPYCHRGGFRFRRKHIERLKQYAILTHALNAKGKCKSETF